MGIAHNKTHKNGSWAKWEILLQFLCAHLISRSSVALQFGALSYPSCHLGALCFIRRNGSASLRFMATRGVTAININHTKAV